MPSETQDRDPYWAARSRLSAQQLEDIRAEASRVVAERMNAAARALTPAKEAAWKAVQESGDAARRFAANVQAETDRLIRATGHAVVGQGPEAPRSGNPVARWAEGQVGRGGYGLLNTAPEARGPVNNRLPRDKRGFADPKCNQFVWDALDVGGAPTGRMEGGRIPVAREWGDPSSKIAGYAPVVDAPRPGDVVSNGHHVGIYSPLPDGSHGTVSAATPFTRDGGWDGGVVHNAWGFRREDGPVTIWRPTAAASAR